MAASAGAPHSGQRLLRVILGILSDTHGQRRRTADAVRVLRAAGAAALVHCGDVGAAGVLDELAGWRAWVVWGNCDRAVPELPAHAESLGVTAARATPLVFRLDGHTLAVFHGHEPAFARVEHRAHSPVTASPDDPLRDCDYVLYGHLHVPRDERIGRLRVINPGALHRARTPTVATLDLRSDRLDFWQVPDGAADLRPANLVL